MIADRILQNFFDYYQTKFFNMFKITFMKKNDNNYLLYTLNQEIIFLLNDLKVSIFRNCCILSAIIRETIFNRTVYEEIGYNVDNRKGKRVLAPKILYIIRIIGERRRELRDLDRNLFGRQRIFICKRNYSMEITRSYEESNSDYLKCVSSYNNTSIKISSFV